MSESKTPGSTPLASQTGHQPGTLSRGADVVGIFSRVRPPASGLLAAGAQRMHDEPVAQPALPHEPSSPAPPSPHLLYERVKAELRSRVEGTAWVAAAFVSRDGRAIRIHGDVNDLEHDLDAHVIGVQIQRAVDPSLSVLLDVEYRDNGHRMAPDMEGVYEREEL